MLDGSLMPVHSNAWAACNPITKLTVIVANLPYTSPDDRYVVGPLVSFPNGTAWNSYKIEIVDNKGPDTGTGGANSIQFAEVQLFSGSVPEPSVALLAIGGAVAMMSKRRRS